MRPRRLLVALLLGGVAAGVPVPLGQPGRPALAAARCDPEKQVLVPDVPSALQRLGATEVWRRATGAGVTVAVVDSGVNPANVHLRDALVPGTSFVPGDGNSGGTTDVTSHGTAVAGIIAARPVGGSGLVGLAREARILPVRVYASEEQGDVAAGRGPTAERIAAGIRYAADQRARVIVVPLSLPEPSPALTGAVAYATGRGSLLVASAGNREETPDQPDGPRYPAAEPTALAVGAATDTDDVSEQSTTGPHVDVIAPGTNVLTAFFGAGDCLLDPGAGVTSWAAAYVAAAAATVAQVHPDAPPAELAYRLEVTADRPIRGRRDDSRGWGLVQPLEAIEAPLDPGRAGPPLPGSRPAAVRSPAPRTIDIRPLADPAARQKKAGGWWLLAGAGVLGLALLGAAGTAARRRTGSDQAEAWPGGREAGVQR
jgi:membrane-anchored mycosin MYCP